MAHVTPEQIEQAKKIDLLSYLQFYEPQELVHFSGDVYTTRTHDSLKISNGKWCWWSRGIGGRSALDYLIKVRGMTLPDAAMLINGQAVTMLPARIIDPDSIKPKVLILPEKHMNNDRVIAYLASRGISRGIIEYCIRTGRLYESREYHNAVFVGFDKEGAPRYGAFRGTSSSRFMGDVSGSDKRFSFSIPVKGESEKLHLFESAIDLLSFATLELLAGRDWRQDHCLSLAGVNKPRKNIEECTVPAALEQYLKDHPLVGSVSLHLDNDAAGRIATEVIITKLNGKCIVIDCPPREGKDYNEMLHIQRGSKEHLEYRWIHDR